MRRVSLFPRQRQGLSAGVWAAASLVVRRVVALVVLLGALFAGGSAHAAPPPDQMPPGYTVERIGAIRWTYPTSAETEAKELAREVDSSWSTLADRFGVRTAPDLDLRIALNPEQMQALAPPGRKLPSYASGVAFPAEGLILMSFSAPRSFERPNMRKLLVHELTHVALHRAVAGEGEAEASASRRVPRWLSEGVAVHEAGENTIDRIRVLWEGALAGRLIRIADLDHSFSSEHGTVDLAYAQSADIVAYILDGDGDAIRFRVLITQLRSGAEIEQAFSRAYGFSVLDLERAWRERVARRFGRWPSMLVGLSALWAFGAVLLFIGYIRVRRRQRRTLDRWAIEEEAVVAAPAPAAPPPPPPVSNPPSPRGPDDVLDAWQEQKRRDGELPTVTHEGRSYTLH
jgi:hypothetical protein